MRTRAIYDVAGRQGRQKTDEGDGQSRIIRLLYESESGKPTLT